MRGHELFGFTDPSEEEYAPTNEELKGEDRARQIVLNELADIDHELARPTEDRFTGEKNKFAVTDPAVFWDRLAYLRIDHIDTIKDPVVRKELDSRIAMLEQRIYKQFVPFIESRVAVFGLQHSPLENSVSRRKIQAADIAEQFEEAYRVLEVLKISEEQHFDFLNELNRLQEKLDRYRSEVTLFTFEKIEEELHREFYDLEYGGWYSPPGQKARPLEDARATKERQIELDLLVAKAHSLNHIAERMLHEHIRLDCQARSKSILEWAEYYKAKAEAPREMYILEATLKELLEKAKNKEDIDEHNFEQAKKRLNDLETQRLGSESATMLPILKKLILAIERQRAGNSTDEDEDRFTAEKGVDWAWVMLGVGRDALQDEVKKAYHSLARTYHPDTAKVADATEKMKQINEAYEFVKRVKKWK